jgi:hypothetical protein
MRRAGAGNVEEQAVRRKNHGVEKVVGRFLLLW